MSVEIVAPDHNQMLNERLQGEIADGREAALRRLLPYDYDYAKDNGLIDMFYYDPDTGEDGLMHTLAGQTVVNKDGAHVSQGFHHEPSAEYIWPELVDNEGQTRVSTRVERDHLNTMSADKRRQFKQYPYEPYKAQVVINGLRKMTIMTDPKTGKRTLTWARTTMYPHEYDALVVMQAVRMAYEGRNTENDELTEDENGQAALVNVGQAVLIDGKTPMNIRLIMDPATHKIKTAIPTMPNKPGVMKLTQEQADKYAFGQEV
jgi:hypothetical protein